MSIGALYQSRRIRMPDGTLSWTAVDANFVEIPQVRNWVVHLEATGRSPNSIRAYLRYVVLWCSYLDALGSSFLRPNIENWDRFLIWYAKGSGIHEFPDPKQVSLFHKPRRLSAELQNQAHSALKSFYRFLTSRDDFEVDSRFRVRAYDGQRTYKQFLEHISARLSVRKKDEYRNGVIGLGMKNAAFKRLIPQHVIRLINSCHLARDSFLIALLYSTGMRIGEALGLHHKDIDVAECVIWITPRYDNENGARVKNSRIRSVCVPAELMRMYENFIISKEYLSAFNSGTEYVFCNVKKGRIGRALTASYASNLRKMLISRSGIPFTWHHFRHTHASEIIGEGYSLLEVSERIGHVSPQTTADTYQHLFSSEVRKLQITSSDRLAKLLESFNEASLIGKDLRWL